MADNVTRLPVAYMGDHSRPTDTGTCDAGDCDEEVEAIVRVDEDPDKWLAMCNWHAVNALGGYTQTDVESWDDQ